MHNFGYTDCDAESATVTPNANDYAYVKVLDNFDNLLSTDRPNVIFTATNATGDSTNTAAGKLLLAFKDNTTSYTVSVYFNGATTSAGSFTIE